MTFDSVGVRAIQQDQVARPTHGADLMSREECMNRLVVFVRDVDFIRQGQAIAG